MSTRVAYPLILGNYRMSELRRQLLPSSGGSSSSASNPTNNQDRAAQVRRNLFGPIDHDENLKFVQDELTKISQTDEKRWNFDFQSEKPKDGRYRWERVEEAVPQAYEMTKLNYIAKHSSSTVSSTSSSSSSSSSSTATSTPVPEGSTSTASVTTTNLLPSHLFHHHQVQLPSSSSSSSSPPTTAASITTTTTTTTISTKVRDSPTTTTVNPPPSLQTRTTTASTTTSSSSDSSIKCISESKKSDILDTRESKTIKNTKTKTSSQPSLKAFMKISKPKRTASKMEDEQPPALKRPKTTS